MSWAWGLPCNWPIDPKTSGHPLMFWVLADSSQEQPQQPGPPIFRVKKLDLTYSSGLLVKYDPGVWLVYAGFIAMLPGFWLAFFVPRQRWAVAVQPQGKGKYSPHCLRCRRSS